MKSFGPALAWRFKLLLKLPRNIVSAFIRHKYPVRKGLVMCWAYNFRQYGCNPKALTEYLLEHNDEDFEICWAFRKGIDTTDIDSRIRCVHHGSLEYIKLANTAEFLITNFRTHPYDIFWKKRPGQKYLMLWHGGTPLKKIEKDVEEKLGYQYPLKAKADSKACDLMISGCRLHTRLVNEKFWYDGEVLEKGLPRSDIFFNKSRHAAIRESVCQRYGIRKDSFILLYAPTFRKPVTIEPYRLDWNAVIEELRTTFSTKDVTVLLRLHPNLIGKCDTSSLLNSPEVKDATMYPDMQELLCASDMLITDYSSSMFDMMMLGRPCILYAKDKEKYDRGYYFELDKLPFPLTVSENELIEHIRNFNLDRYLEECKQFDSEFVGSVERGEACSELVNWMKTHR